MHRLVLAACDRLDEVRTLVRNRHRILVVSVLISHMLIFISVILRAHRIAVFKSRLLLLDFFDFEAHHCIGPFAFMFLDNIILNRLLSQRYRPFGRLIDGMDFLL